ncbi:glycosidase [Hephaestia sp. GCM10023244]|uniref:glycoside hydrolase family 130 protein n=1 Tax=unclassified Hephaestia TaxID=2631281 RepID=UPI00207710CE|nr:glycosidase [Hephaestia sp. MAHUQ-44]MCM8729526.1 glycosidase [Hephaestia sp. MAHUQ-44]
MRRTGINFAVETLEPVTLHGPPLLAERDLMSPYVWQEATGRFGIMVRAVPTQQGDRSDTGVIWAGWSDDGRTFEMEDTPAIVPGPDAIDIGGVEDPTVLRTDDGYVVYYTGVEADRAHGEMLYATGPSIDALVKQGVALASSKTAGNTKEATVGRTADGHWRLWYEYAADNASRVGLAIGPGVAGPWDEQPTPFLPRPNSWDNWHLSTGPMLMDTPDCPVMFYNGATRDARWRIGWVAFDRDCRRVIDRGIEPLIIPPPVDDRSATDIAFAASVIVRDGTIWLYYSLEDRRLARAAIIRYG